MRQRQPPIVKHDDTNVLNRKRAFRSRFLLLGERVVFLYLGYFPYQLMVSQRKIGGRTEEKCAFTHIYITLMKRLYGGKTRPSK